MNRNLIVIVGFCISIQNNVKFVDIWYEILCVTSSKQAASRLLLNSPEQGQSICLGGFSSMVNFNSVDLNRIWTVHWQLRAVVVFKGV